MRLPTIDELQWAGGAIASLAAIVRLAKPRALSARARIKAHFDGVHRMIEKVDRIEGEVTAIGRRVEAELGPNGGGSLKDLITIIEARQTAIFDRMERAGFEAYADGRFRSVNRAFEKLTGYPARDLIGMGWVNLLHQEEADAFLEVWAHAIQDGRQIRRTCRIVTAENREVLVYIDAAPVRAGGAVREWQGTFCLPEAA